MSTLEPGTVYGLHDLTSLLRPDALRNSALQAKLPEPSKRWLVTTRYRSLPSFSTQPTARVSRRCAAHTDEVWTEL